MVAQSPQKRVERHSRWLYLFSATLLLSLCCFALYFSSISSPQIAHAASVSKSSALQHDEFWAQTTAGDFGAWTLNGVAVSGTTSSAQVQLASGSNLTCVASDIDGGAASYNASVGLCAGVDPMAAGSYDSGLNYYNGGSFSYGTLVSPVHTTQQTINTLVASWNASTPADTWMEVHVRVLENGSWTHWYDLPIWANDFSTIHRHSVNGQSDTTGDVQTDTFVAKSSATAYQLGITLFTTTPGVSPSLTSVGAIASYNSTAFPTISPDSSVWGTNLNVPQRSQMLSQYQGLGYGGGGEVWCSPTSTSMVMAYWSNVLSQANLNQTVPDAAQGTYDFTYQGTGNWPFNTAYATEFGGLHAFVTRMYSMSQVEQWIKAGVPIIISIAFSKHQLPGAPISSSTGHLIVVRGFASNGDVITNDPAAASDAQVQITYNRADLQNVWLNGSNGTVYVIYPNGWATPTVDANGSW